MILVLKHISIEGPGLLGDFLAGLGEDLRVIDLEKGDPLPDSLEGVDGVIVLGGPMNVYEEDKYPFLKGEDRFIKTVIAEDVPYLGICLGAQLLVKAAGGRVIRAPEKEIGWYKVRITGEGMNDGLFERLHDELEVFQWHEDTFSVPERGVLLVEGERCRNQAVRVGECAYGIQFHLEVDDAMIIDWSNEYFSGADGSMRSKSKEMIDFYYDKEDMLLNQAGHFFYNFKKVIDEHRKGPRSLRRRGDRHEE